MYDIYTARSRYHTQFPDPLKLAVKTMMLAQQREESPLHLLPAELVYQVMEKCEWDAFGTDGPTAESSEEDEEDESSQRWGILTSFCRHFCVALAWFCDILAQLAWFCSQLDDAASDGRRRRAWWWWWWRWASRGAR